MKNEPAFPNTPEMMIACGGVGGQGMSLRDYFAAHAPECPKWFYEIKADGSEIAQQRTIACWAYSYADAMLIERDR